MPGTGYSLKINGVAHQAQDITVEMANRRPTRVTLTDVARPGQYVLTDADDPGQFAEVEVEFAGLRFACSFTVFDAQKTGPSWSNTLECRPRGLHLLACCDYFQRWFSKASADASPVEERSGFVVLNQDASGNGVSVEAQLQDIFAAAAALLGPAAPTLHFQGAIGPLVQPPNEDRNLPMLDAVLKTLQMFPGVIIRDAHGDGDTVDILQNPAPWQKPPGQFLSDRSRRDATGVDRVDIEFVRSGADGGAVCNTITHDIAERPGASPLRTLNGTLMFTGASSNRTRNGIDVETRDIPEDLNDADFWRANMPGFFDAPDIANLVIHDARRGLPGDAQLYPRVCANTPLPDLLDAGVEIRARAEAFSCLADITRKNQNNETFRDQKNVPVQCELAVTNAVTKRYEWTDSWDAESAEPLPFGIASQILNAYPATGARVARFRLDDPANPVPPLVGETFKGLPCQRCVFSLRSGECEADFTPSPEQSLEDRAKLITGFRGRVQARWNKATRESGEVKSDNTLSRNASQPMSNAYAAGDGELKKETLTGASDDDKKIILDPDDITGENKAAKMREVAYVTLGDGGSGESPAKRLKLRAWRAHILATEPQGDGAYTDPCPDACECGGGSGGGGDGGGGGEGGEGGGGEGGQNREDCYPGGGGDRTYPNDDDRSYPKDYPCWP